MKKKLPAADSMTLINHGNVEIFEVKVSGLRMFVISSFEKELSIIMITIMILIMIMIIMIIMVVSTSATEYYNIECPP